MSTMSLVGPSGAPSALLGAEVGRGALLMSSMRRQVLSTLLAQGSDEGAQGCSAGQVAQALGLHVTTARFHLDALISAGVVESFRERRGTVGRPRTLYRVRAQAVPLAGADVAFARLARLIDAMWRDPQVTAPRARAQVTAWAGAALSEGELPDAGAVAAPRTVGSWLVQVERIAQMAQRWGYVHELTLDRGGQVVELSLTADPFAAIGRSRPEVTAGVYAGLMDALVARFAGGRPVVEVLGSASSGLALRLTLPEPFERPVRLRASGAAGAARRRHPTLTPPVQHESSPHQMSRSTA